MSFKKDSEFPENKWSSLFLGGSKETQRRESATVANWSQSQAWWLGWKSKMELSHINFHYVSNCYPKKSAYLKHPPIVQVFIGHFLWCGNLCMVVVFMCLELTIHFLLVTKKILTKHVLFDFVNHFLIFCKFCVDCTTSTIKTWPKFRSIFLPYIKKGNI